MEKHLRQTIDYPYTLMYEEVYKAARNKPCLLYTSMSAILSALIFNAIVIPCLMPIAMKGVKYKPMSAQKIDVYKRQSYCWSADFYESSGVYLE